MIPHRLVRLPAPQMLRRARTFFEAMKTRRSVRDFSTDPVPLELIELAVATAATAPSGAHRQPWRFVAVGDPALKRRIRLAAEAEERDFYEGGQTPEAWLEALAPLGTNWEKPHLELAPWLVVVFAEIHGRNAAGTAVQNYYVKESVGIACGLFIAAIHTMGLATLPHTPSPMRFLNSILDRPGNERPYVLFPVGFPAAEATVPDLRRKPLADVLVWHVQAKAADVPDQIPGCGGEAAAAP